MGISCGATLIKYILFIFNLLWLVLGGVVIWLGITISSWSSDVNTLIDINMKAGSISILVTGAIIFLIAFLGCCGAIKENSCMLSTYGGVILILVVVQCVGIYFAFKNKSDVESKIKDGIKDNFLKFEDNKDKALNGAIQQIQKTFECCGPNGFNDYTGLTIPNSCCGESNFGDDNHNTCLKTSVKYKEGCVDKVYEKLKNYLVGLAGVAIGLILIQIIIVLSACCLSREVRN
jgi:CD63 antigen